MLIRIKILIGIGADIAFRIACIQFKAINTIFNQVVQLVLKPFFPVRD